jgi:RNA polymerase subunit RPABC4/transcription elongation factor Spt4
MKCVICGCSSDYGGSLTDHGGGSPIEVCTGCLEYLEAARCRLCGAHSTTWNGRDGTVSVVTDEGDGDEPDEWTDERVCPTCRRELLDAIHGDGPAVMEQ